MENITIKGNIIEVTRTLETLLEDNPNMLILHLATTSYIGLVEPDSRTTETKIAMFIIYKINEP